MPSSIPTQSFDEMSQKTLFPHLDERLQAFVEGISRRYHLTFQELRFLAQAARDLDMWREESLEHWWSREPLSYQPPDRNRKKQLLQRLRQHLDALAKKEKEYSDDDHALKGVTREPIRLIETNEERTLFGRCAAYSDKTVCCGLYTIDMVTGCPYACSYCTIQTFYKNTAELPKDLPEKMRKISLDPNRFYHIGTGQASDSLVWGNRGGIIDAIVEFCREHSNVLFELKSKSDNVEPLLERELPPNLVVSWSLNTPTVIANEEHGTASLEQRISAARRLVEHGTKVGFHFHPMVFYKQCAEDYETIAHQLIRQFRTDEVLFVSMGTVTFIRPVVQQIRKRGGESKILQMEMAPDPHGKLTYPDDVKIELYSTVYRALSPWHSSVFIYLCMEPAEIWRAALGRVYENNRVFEDAFRDHWLAT